jgi:drug/metabolite transporter (DMT)-like permease
VLTNPWTIDWNSSSVLIGHAFLLSAALCWAVAILVTRVSRPRLTMFELLPWCFLLASVVLAPLVLVHAPHGTLGTQPRAWAAFAYIGLVAGPLGTWCAMEAMAKLPAVVSSVGFLMTPAVGLLFANLFLGEPVTVDLLCGSALIMGGAAFAALPGRRVR